MAVGDFLGQYRVAGNFAPVDLTCESVDSSMERGVLQDMRERESLTSFRFFCCRIANRNRAMALSLFDMMLTDSEAGELDK